MNNTFKNVFIFALGGAVGAFITWKFVESKCESRIQEEVASVKKAFQERYVRMNDDCESESVDCEDEDESETNGDLPDIKKYAEELKDKGYVKYSTAEDDMDVAPVQSGVTDGPYVISPEDFGEFEDYERISLFYYEDGYLADRNDELVDDIEGAIGSKSLGTFGQYEDDAVHVRNDARKCDYEILRSAKRYADVIKTTTQLYMED